MPLLVVTYAKGRQGATTVALGLAATAPAEAGVVLLECDPTGGDLMRRHRLAARPSIVDLAAAARSAHSPAEAFTGCTQVVSLRTSAVPVVCSPAGGAQTRAALAELAGAGRAVLTTPTRLVVADCGRIEAGCPTWPLLEQASAVIVLARARPDELAHLREHLGALLDAASGWLVLLLAPDGHYTAREVSEALSLYVAEELAFDPNSVTVLGPLPRDRRAAAVLRGELLAGQGWRRLPLLRALATVHQTLGLTHPRLAIRVRR